ncbi:MAG: septum formation initiator family protein [Candidatus Omnitrophica bacterium]|nr:septum formation initiator family protein [Candidatus Omnitrophota bacterium]
MLKKFFFVLAVGIVLLLVLAWIYVPSFSRYRELKLEEEKLTQKIAEIDAQIKALATERNLLQTDVAYLEKVIREELGFVKPGEIVYELITQKRPVREAGATTEAQHTAAVAPQTPGIDASGSAPTIAEPGKTESAKSPAKPKLSSKST